MDFTMGDVPYDEGLPYFSSRLQFWGGHIRGSTAPPPRPIPKRGSTDLGGPVPTVPTVLQGGIPSLNGVCLLRYCTQTLLIQGYH